MPLLRSGPTRETIALALGVAALGIIAAAWGFELIGGFVPCKLCLQQRSAYYLGTPLVFLAFFVDRFVGPAWLARLALLGFAGFIAWGFSIGFYQAGAEWGFWPGPTDCAATRGADIPAAAGDLLSSLAKVKIADCSKPQIRILGLSFAGWNVLMTSALIVASLVAVFARPRRVAEG